MNKIIDPSEIPSLEEFEEEMDRSPTWTEKQLRKILGWISSKDQETQSFIGQLIFPAALGYAMMSPNLKKIGFIELVLFPFAYMVGGLLSIVFMIVKFISQKS